MSKQKTCKQCQEDKPLEEFSRDISSDDGKAYKCKKCASEYMRNYNKGRKRDKSSSPLPISSITKFNGKKTSLDFLMNISLLKEGKYGLEMMRKIVGLLHDGKGIDEIAKEVDGARSSIRCIFNELKKAAEEKMTLEQYVKAGRPFRYGRKVVA